MQRNQPSARRIRFKARTAEVRAVKAARKIEQERLAEERRIASERQMAWEAAVAHAKAKANKTMRHTRQLVAQGNP